MSVTFDGILPAVQDAFLPVIARTPKGAVLVNRDLSGRVRLIVREACASDPDFRSILVDVARALEQRLGPHGVPADDAVLVEPDFDEVVRSAAAFPLFEDDDTVLVADRLALETDWSVTDEASSTPRIVFYSVKGGVGRSTALAATAWSLAQQGERVLIVDLDLESPGLSTAVLPEGRKPAFGLVDWLVEDQVGAGDHVQDDMIAASGLHAEQDVLVLPAHGAEPGEYIAKLGRAWVPQIGPDGTRTSWTARVDRLLTELEHRHKRTIVLIDARSGLDEIAALSVAGLGAHLVLCFATDAPTTWTAYRILLEHWKKLGVASRIRERLQVVGALVPGDDPTRYLQTVREQSWTTFLDTLYDVEPPTAPENAVLVDHDPFSFDVSNDDAPHAPWPVRWSASFASLSTLHGRLAQPDALQIEAAFGPVIRGVATYADRNARTAP